MRQRTAATRPGCARAASTSAGPRHGPRTGTAVAPFTVRTSSVSRAVAVQPTGGSLPYVAAALATSDPLLDAMAFSRGRFVIQQQGASTLVIPAYAEVGRVIEDCRG